MKLSSDIDAHELPLAFTLSKEIITIDLLPKNGVCSRNLSSAGIVF